MMVHHTCSIAMLLTSAALAAVGMQRTGWLDRVVQYQKEKLFKEFRELAPININAEFRPKPEGYVDSTHWDYDSVIRLLTLIRKSEASKPVRKALRRMLQPTRRIMMSMKESMHRFPSIKKDDNAFYYDVDYSSEEGNLPASPPVLEDEVVLHVSNPVEARLPSAKISVKLLREILEARARAARQMPSTKHIIPWIEFIKTRRVSTESSTETDSTSTMSLPPAQGGNGLDGNKDGDDHKDADDSSSTSSTNTASSDTDSSPSTITGSSDTDSSPSTNTGSSDTDSSSTNSASTDSSSTTTTTEPEPDNGGGG